MSSFRFFAFSWFIGTFAFYAKIKYDINKRNILIYDEIEEIKSKINKNKENLCLPHEVQNLNERNIYPLDNFIYIINDKAIQKDFILEFLLDSFFSKRILINIIKIVDFTKNYNMVKLIEKFV